MELPRRCLDCPHLHRHHRQAGSWAPCLHPERRRIVGTLRSPDAECPLRPRPDPAGIYERQRAFMAGVAVNHVHNREDAEDIVQEAAIRLLEQRRPVEDERALAYTVVDHAAHEWLDRQQAMKRDARRTDRLDLADHRHHRRVSSAERTALARLELAELLADAPLIVAAVAAGYSITETAAAQRVNVKTLHARLTRWRRARQAAE